jgi:hypothetical protein
LGNPQNLFGQENNNLSSSIYMDPSTKVFGQELSPQNNWSFYNPEQIINLKIYPNPTNKILNISFSTLVNTFFMVAILASLSVISIYLARIVQEQKARPIYIVSEIKKINF